MRTFGEQAMGRRAAHRRRAALVVAAIVPVYGLLRVFIGLLHLFLPEAMLEEVPDLLSSVNNLQALATGLILFVLGFGLLRRKRFAHVLTALVLAGAFVSGLLLQGSPWLWGTAVGLFASLVLLWRQFSEPSELSFKPGQAVALGVVLLTVGYGVIGAYLLRNEFEGLHSWGDAFYYAVSTLTTLGMGDIVPNASSQTAKFFSVSLVVVGISTFITAMSLVFVPILESQMKGVMRAMDRFRYRTLENHVIVCYYTQVGASVVDELKGKGERVLIVEPNESIAETLQALKNEVLQGDPTEESILHKANLGTARAIVGCSDEDAHNAMITLIAREAKVSGGNPELRIVTRVEQEAGLTKMRSAGADHAISPSTLGGRMMGKLAAGENLDRVKDELDRMLF